MDAHKAFNARRVQPRCFVDAEREICPDPAAAYVKNCGSTIIGKIEGDKIIQTAGPSFQRACLHVVENML